MHKLKQKDLGDKAGSFIENAREVSGVKLLQKTRKCIRGRPEKTVDLLMKSGGEMAIVLGTTQNERATIIVALSPMW